MFVQLPYVLCLRDNGIGSKTGEQLAQAFRVIPASVTTLDLSENYLDKKTGAELAEAFAAIPASVTTLDLSMNSLYKKTEAELAEAFQAIPVTVGYLKDHDIPMAVFERLEHPISWMTKAKRLLELYKKTTDELQTATAIEYRTNALKLLLAIPPQSPLYREAAQLLWRDLYREYLAQKALGTITMPFAAGAGVVSEAPTKEISLEKVIEYAIAAGEGKNLLSAVYPGISYDDEFVIDSNPKFMLCSKYILARQASNGFFIDIHLNNEKLSEFKPHMHDNIKFGPGYGF